jgi:hypothetical protein
MIFADEYEKNGKMGKWKKIQNPIPNPLHAGRGPP